MEDKKFEKMRFKGKLKIDYLNLRCIYFHLLEENIDIPLPIFLLKFCLLFEIQLQHIVIHRIILFLHTFI